MMVSDILDHNRFPVVPVFKKKKHYLSTDQDRAREDI